MRDHPEPWAALAIAAMWVAVLMIGLWGGDIISGASGSSSGSSVPAVVVVAPCALVATIVIARRAFGRHDVR